MAYHKVYMNQIFSTSLTGQLAFMWRKELLCDAIIKAGNFSTKAHRLVMIAACPMLQHMENASLGSHLEVRLSSDISIASIKMFLQYLYEGFMKLTEDNFKEIEKIGKVLQVDSVTKCCIDFAKCLRQQSDQHYLDVNEFGIQEQAEFKFVKATDLEKTFSPANSTEDFEPSHKRARVQSGKRQSTGLDYPSRTYPEDNTGGFVTSHQNQQSTQSQPIEILDDGVEVITSEPAQRDVEGWPVDSNQPPVQHSMAVGVSTQSGTKPDVRVISISDRDVQIPISTPAVSQHSPLQQSSQISAFPSHPSAIPVVTEQLGTRQPMTSPDVPVQRVSQSSPFTSTPCQLVPVSANQRKPFAAGNEAQLNISKDVEPSVYTGGNFCGLPEANLVDTGGTSGLTQAPTSTEGRSDSSYMEHDQDFQDSEISIIKVEHVSEGESLEIAVDEGRPSDQQETIYVQKAPSSDNDGEDYSNEASNISEGPSELQDTASQDQDMYQCKVCSAVLESAESLLLHLQSHARDNQESKPVTMAPNVAYLEQHRRKKRTDRSPYTCGVCGESCKTISKFLVHTRIHSEQTAFTCPGCNKSFIDRSHLDRHNCTNVGQKRCRKCNGLYYQLHKHEKECEVLISRPFVCKFCSRSFQQRRYLMEHMKSMHTQKNRYTCSVCQKVFQYRHTFNAHKRSAHGNSY